MSDWREISGSQNLHLSQKVLEQQGEINDLKAKLEEQRVQLRDAHNDLLDVRGILAPAGEARKVPMDLVPTVAPAVQWLVAALGRAEGLVEAARRWREGLPVDAAQWAVEGDRRLAAAVDLHSADGGGS